MNISAALSAAKAAATSKAGLALLAGQKHSPAILFGVGVVGVVGTAILASKATLKLDEELDHFMDRKELAKVALESRPGYTEEKYKRDMVIIHAAFVRRTARLYAPAVIVGVGSIAALGGSHVILTKRNAALTATVTAVTKAFDEYRGRVREELGEDKDREFMYGKDTREVLTYTNKGNPKVENVTTFGDGQSPYSKVFDAENYNFQDTWEANGWFLQLIQSLLNDKLKVKGYVLLNEVYRELGMAETEPGCVTGWRTDGDGDGFIDFGCWKDGERGGFNPFNVRADGSILLDFNVDGAIFKTLGNPTN